MCISCHTARSHYGNPDVNMGLPETEGGSQGICSDLPSRYSRFLRHLRLLDYFGNQSDWRKGGPWIIKGCSRVYEGLHSPSNFPSSWEREHTPGPISKQSESRENPVSREMLTAHHHLDCCGAKVGLLGRNIRLRLSFRHLLNPGIVKLSLDRQIGKSQGRLRDEFDHLCPRL